MSATELHEAVVHANHAARTTRYALAQALLALRDARAYQPLGYATLREYAEAEHGIDGRRLRDLVGVARAASAIPHVDEALRHGALDWTKARELLRVATPDTAVAWTERAQQCTNRELERMVSASVQGEAPPDPGDVPAQPAHRRLVFEVDAADADVILAALTHARVAAGDDVDQGAVLAAICRAHLDAVETTALAQRQHADGAPPSPTGERYRVVVHACPRCSERRCNAHDASDEVVAEAACDSEVVDLRPGPSHGHLTRTIPPATRRAVLMAHGGRCAIPGCGCGLWVDVHHLQHRAHGGGHQPDNLVPLCAAHHRLVHAGDLGLHRRADGKLEVVRRTGRRVAWTPPHVGATAQASSPGGRYASSTAPRNTREM